MSFDQRLVPKKFHKKDGWRCAHARLHAAENGRRPCIARSERRSDGLGQIYSDGSDSLLHRCSRRFRTARTGQRAEPGDAGDRADQHAQRKARVPWHSVPARARGSHKEMLGRFELADGVVVEAQLWKSRSTTKPVSFVSRSSVIGIQTKGRRPGQDVTERVGQVLAEAVLVYGDGSEQRLPIRRRFEVNSPSIDWGHLCFQAVPHRSDVPTKLGRFLAQCADCGETFSAASGKATMPLTPLSTPRRLCGFAP